MLRAVSRSTSRPIVLSLALLLVTTQVRADDIGPGRVLSLEGGVAVPTGEYGDHFVGLAVPFRMGVGFQFTQWMWIEPFASLAWVKPISAQEQTPRAGFRILAGAELQIHSTADPLQQFDFYGGLSAAFERVVAHSFIPSCATCEPSASVTLSNGVAFGLRAGVLFAATNQVRLGPYVGAQLSWMPNLAPLVTTAGVTEPALLNPAQFWVEAGIRASISFN
jgi:hypothetical protein